MRWRLFPLAVISLLSPLQAGDLATEAAAILKQNCLACHGEAKMSNLDLRTRETILAGGERGPAVDPGKPDASRLYRFAAGLDKPAMPPGKPLTTGQIATLRQWIEAGAPLTPGAPEPAATDNSAALAKFEERPLTAAERAYWAFRPPQRASVPRNGAANPIDAFLLQVLREKGLKPAPPASPRALLRRAYLDLIGLPPTTAQVDAFLNDHSPTAFAKVVDRTARLATLRRTLGTPLAGRRSLCRLRRLRIRSRPAERLALSRLRRAGAFKTTSRTTASCRSKSPATRSRPIRSEARIATGYLRLGLENNLKNEQTRLDELDDLVSTTSQRLPRADGRLRPLPQSQVRSHSAERLLPASGRFLPDQGQWSIPLVEPADVTASNAAQTTHRRSCRQPLKAQMAASKSLTATRSRRTRRASCPITSKPRWTRRPSKRTEGQRSMPIRSKRH